MNIAMPLPPLCNLEGSLTWITYRQPAAPLVCRHASGSRMQSSYTPPCCTHHIHQRTMATSTQDIHSPSHRDASLQRFSLRGSDHLPLAALTRRLLGLSAQQRLSPPTRFIKPIPRIICRPDYGMQ
jgi:hypothetical protein